MIELMPTYHRSCVMLDDLRYGDFMRTHLLGMACSPCSMVRGAEGKGGGHLGLRALPATRRALMGKKAVRPQHSSGCAATPPILMKCCSISIATVR